MKSCKAVKTVSRNQIAQNRNIKHIWSNSNQSFSPPISTELLALSF